MPATLRILLIFTFILAVIKRLSLGNAFCLGAILLGFAFGMEPLKLIPAMIRALIHLKTLALSLVVSLILILSHSMEATGQMERLLSRFKGLFASPVLNLAMFPALIGLLPMPGGAVFSAPLVSNIASHSDLDQARLSFLNYWFRHIWEYWWPLYPGVLLATTLTGIDLWSYVLVMLPLTPVAIVAGRIFLGPVSVPANQGSGAVRPPLAPFLCQLTPIAIVIFGGLGAGFCLSLTDMPAAKELGLIMALVTAIGLVWHQGRLAGKTRLKLVFSKKLLAMYYMVSAVLIFKEILEASGAVNMISSELMAWRIGLVPVSVILPMLVGAVSGITIAFVGTTFPVIFALLNALGHSDHLAAFMLLAMAAGFAGVLVSPLHLCLLLSNAFFKASHSAVYRLIFPAVTLLLAAALAYFAILYYIV